MSIVGVTGLCVMGWVLTASGSVAGSPDLLDRPVTRLSQQAPLRFERAELVDQESGAELRLTAKSGGGLQASLAWTDLAVTKVLQPNGDFTVRITARQDLLVLARTGNRLRVTRGDQSAVMLMDRSDEDGLDLVQHVLAGSRAARAFRGVHRRLSQETRESAPGVSLDNLDALLGILQGEPGVVERHAPRQHAGWRLSRVACVPERGCFSEYEVEVVAAWGDFSQCVDDVSWYPGLQEVCAFTWLLRAESAWFRFIGCSSIPLRTE